MARGLKVPRRSSRLAFVPDLKAGMNARVDARVLSFGEAAKAYNVCVESGALKNGYGITDAALKMPMDAVYVYTFYDEPGECYRTVYLGYTLSGGHLYAADTPDGTWTKLEGAHFYAPPLGVNYRLRSEDVFLLCGEEGMAVVHPSFSVVSVTTAPSITSLSMHNERMFVTIGGRRNAVWFSDDLDPTNWNPELDEGGFIELEGTGGMLNKAVSFGGYVYIFRDYGISRLYAYGAQSDFSISNLFVSSGRIYADTVAVCGDRILFYAEDGLYAFDGISTARICRNLEGLFAAEPQAIACYCAGKYYLAAASAEGNGQRDLLVVVDPHIGTVSVSSPISVKRFSPLTTPDGEQLLVHTADGRTGVATRSGKYYETPLRKSWKSGESDLGAPDTRKLFREVCLSAAEDCTVTLATERGSKQLYFRGKSAPQRRRIHLVGSKLVWEIAADGDMDAARFAVKYSAVT